MYLEDDEEEFDLVGEQNYKEEPDEDEAEETSEAEEEEAKVAEGEETEEAEPDEEEAEVEEKPAKDNRVSAISAERARRKAAEKELKELKAQLAEKENVKNEEEQIQSEREAYKKKMLDGDIVDEEVADKLLDVFGDDLIKTRIANEKRTKNERFEEAFKQLKGDELFIDADDYKDQIKDLVDKGLGVEEAYFASVGKGKFSQLKKNLEVELEQRMLNNNSRADKVDVGVSLSKGEIKKGNYTKREQEIAKETGLPVAEVHKRYLKPGETYSMEDIENL